MFDQECSINASSRSVTKHLGDSCSPVLYNRPAPILSEQFTDSDSDWLNALRLLFGFSRGHPSLLLTSTYGRRENIVPTWAPHRSCILGRL